MIKISKREELENVLDELIIAYIKSRIEYLINPPLELGTEK